MTKKSRQLQQRGPQIVILVIVAIAIGVILIAKGQPPAPPSAPSTPVAVESPEVILDRALAAKQPTLAFFHSLTCDSCIEMTAIVEQIYPEFEGAITLVDVNVYEARNQSLLQRAQIRAIPTLVFIDHTGQGQMFMGVMEATQRSSSPITRASPERQQAFLGSEHFVLAEAHGATSLMDGLGVP